MLMASTKVNLAGGLCKVGCSVFAMPKENGLRWTSKTGPGSKIDSEVQKEGGIRIGTLTESAYSGVQNEGGIGLSEGVGDGERVGLAAQGSPEANSSVEEADTGGRGSGLQQRNRAEDAG